MDERDGEILKEEENNYNRQQIVDIKLRSETNKQTNNQLKSKLNSI